MLDTYPLARIGLHTTTNHGDDLSLVLTVDLAANHTMIHYRIDFFRWCIERHNVTFRIGKVREMPVSAVCQSFAFDQCCDERQVEDVTKLCVDRVFAREVREMPSETVSELLILF